MNKEKAINLRGSKGLYLAIKYLPVIATISICSHYGLYLIDKEYFLAELLVGSSVSILILGLMYSSSLNMCWYHKTLIVYMALGDLLIDINRWIGFGNATRAVCWSMFLIGCILLIMAVLGKLNLIKFKYNDD